MTPPARDRCATRLAIGIAFAAVVWRGLLPWLLAFGPVARHVGLMEERGVDPAAMYYTELERLPLRPGWVEDRLILWPWQAVPSGATLGCDQHE